MAQFNISGSSALDASYKLALRQKVCAVSSVQARIAALEGNLLGAANTTSSSRTAKPDFEKRFTATLTLNMRPSSLTVQSFKPAETQRDTDSSGSSVPSHPKNVVMSSAVKANTAVSSKTTASLASAKPAWMNDRRLVSITILRPETQKPNVPSFPKVHQSTKLSRAQQHSVTKEPRLTDSDDGVENIIRTKPRKLPETQKPKYIRTCGTQNKLQRESTDLPVPKRSLPDVLALGNPPPKPNRLPSVDIHRFRRNRTSLNDGPGMKIPYPVAPPLPPLRSCPSSNHAAALSQQLDKDESYDDVGIMNPPPLPSEEHPSRRTEEPKGTINSEEMKRQEEKKQLKQQKAKEKRDRKAKKKLKIKGPKGKALVDFKGEKSDMNQDEIIEIVHNTGNPEGQWLARNMEGYYDYVNTVDTGHDDLKEEEETGPMSSQSEAESDVYDDIGAPAEVCSGLSVQNLREDDVYDDVDNPDTRVSPTTDGDDVYDDVDSQSPPLPFDGYDIYDEIKEVCIYEIE